MMVERNEKGQPVGMFHHWAKYTDAEVRWVLELRKQGLSCRQIGARLDVPFSTVAAICRGEIRSQTNLWRGK